MSNLTFPDFTLSAPPSLTDYLVGYATAVAGGERRTTLQSVSDLLGTGYFGSLTANRLLLGQANGTLAASDLTYSTPTLTTPDGFNISSAGSLRFSPNGTSGIGLAAPAGTLSRLRLFGPSVSTTPVDSTWYTSANAGLFLGYSEGTGSGAGDFLVAHASDSTNGTNYIGRKARGTLASPTLVSNGDVALGFIGSFFDGTSFRNTAGFNMAADGAASSGTAAPALIQFSTGETTGRTAAVNIRANGRLELGVVGRTTAAWTTNGITFRIIGNTWVDSTSATGTVATAVFSSFAVPTINATNPSVVYTKLANVYIAGDVATTGNASATNSYSLDVVGKTLLEGAVQLPSTNTAGLQLYNTASTSVYERAEMRWSSNAFRILTTFATGSSGPRSLQLGVSATADATTAARTFSITAGSTGTPGTAPLQADFGTTGIMPGSAGMFNIFGTSTGTSGSMAVLSLTPTYNQASGTAANTDLLINRTETAVGSGAQLLADMQVATVSKWKVTNTGNSTQVGSLTTGTPNGGTAGAWKLGIRVAATVVLDTSQYIQVDIGGTLYKLALAV